MTKRPHGKDICELFGYAPDDPSAAARNARSEGYCPFLKSSCTKRITEGRGGNRRTIVLGVCSVVNRKGIQEAEEVMICPNRFYEQNYLALRHCVSDALQTDTLPVFTYGKFKEVKAKASTQNSVDEPVPLYAISLPGIKEDKFEKLPSEYSVLLGQGSGKEVKLSMPGVLSVSLDWTCAHVVNNNLVAIVPLEVQSLDITGTYRNGNWEAYMDESKVAPPSGHGMNWANVWKRLIPQLIIKGNIALHNKLCTKGTYFVLPDRVFVQFEKILGTAMLRHVPVAERGVVTIFTYTLGAPRSHGQIRQLLRERVLRYKLKDLAQAFGAGQHVAELGNSLTHKVHEQLML